MKFGIQYPAIQTELEQHATVNTFESIFDQVFTTYDELAQPLPETSGWKRGKPTHARKAREEVRVFASVLDLSPLQLEYVGLACAAHDLGRMVQGLMRSLRKGEISVIPAPLIEKYSSSFGPDRNEDNPYDDNDEKHGHESALLLEPLLGDFAYTTPGDWLLIAVDLHSLKENPTLEDTGSEEALGLCGVVRDIDRVVAFNHDVDSYLYDEDRKIRERRQNFNGGSPEMGCIAPTEFLMDTPFPQAINRQQCQTYEAYMLQFLKWLPNFMRQDMQDMAIAGGGPQKIAKYLLQQLEATPEQRAKLLTDLQEWRGGILLS